MGSMGICVAVKIAITLSSNFASCQASASSPNTADKCYKAMPLRSSANFHCVLTVFSVFSVSVLNSFLLLGLSNFFLIVDVQNHL